MTELPVASREPSSYLLLNASLQPSHKYSHAEISFNGKKIIYKCRSGECPHEFILCEQVDGKFILKEKGNHSAHNVIRKNLNAQMDLHHVFWSKAEISMPDGTGKHIVRSLWKTGSAITSIDEVAFHKLGGRIWKEIDTSNVISRGIFQEPRVSLGSLPIKIRWEASQMIPIDLEVIVIEKNYNWGGIIFGMDFISKLHGFSFGVDGDHNIIRCQGKLMIMSNLFSKACFQSAAEI